MYDTSQMDHVYFQESAQIHTASFALIPENEIQVSTTVFLMGQISDRDRTFTIEAVGVPEGDTIRVGSVTYPVVAGKMGTDFTVGDLVLPAGKVSAPLNITLHRRPQMKDSCYVRVGIRLTENNEFLPAATDSSKAQAVVSPYYYVYVTDGDPACPMWWRDGKKAPGWHYNLGNYYPDKFRKLLDIYHAAQETSPVFFAYCVEHYGYNLDAEPDKQWNNEMNVFWRQQYASAWAKYVFIPFYEYYKAWYEAHPDDPHFEQMGTEHVNLKAQVGWADPMDGTYGFFN